MSIANPASGNAPPFAPSSVSSPSPTVPPSLTPGPSTLAVSSSASLSDSTSFDDGESDGHVYFHSLIRLYLFRFAVTSAVLLPLLPSPLSSFLFGILFGLFLPLVFTASLFLHPHSDPLSHPSSYLSHLRSLLKPPPYSPNPPTSPFLVCRKEIVQVEGRQRKQNCHVVTLRKDEIRFEPELTRALLSASASASSASFTSRKSHTFTAVPLRSVILRVLRSDTSPQMILLELRDPTQFLTLRMSYVSIVVKGEEGVAEWLDSFRKTSIRIEGERERMEGRDDPIGVGSVRPKMKRLSSAAKFTARIRTSAIDIPTKKDREKEKERREKEREGKMEREKSVQGSREETERGVGVFFLEKHAADCEGGVREGEREREKERRSERETEGDEGVMDRLVREKERWMEKEKEKWIEKEKRMEKEKEKWIEKGEKEREKWMEKKEKEREKKEKEKVGESEKEADKRTEGEEASEREKEKGRERSEMIRAKVEKKLMEFKKRKPDVSAPEVKEERERE